MFDDDEDDDDLNLGSAQPQPQPEAELDDDGNPIATATPVAPAVDSDAITRAIAAGFAQHTPAAPARQPTPEELAKHYQVWNPDAGFVNELNKLTDAEVPLEERAKLLHQMRDGMVGQAFRGAELLLEQKMAEMQAQYAPALKYAQEREAKQLYKEFEVKYPALKGQKELVDSITARLGAQGFRPSSKDEAFEKVAQVAETILKGVNPQFALKASGPANGMPAMAGTHMGGQTGGFQQTGGGQKPAKRGGLASFYKQG